MAIKKNSNKQIYIISGNRDTGKTSLCLLLIDKLKKENKEINGIVSPGLYVDGKKTGILARDIASGKEKKIAMYSPGWDIKHPKREWRFMSDAFEWANDKLKSAVPTDFLIIDEIGYLEIEENKGWSAAMTILDNGLFNCAFVVIRPDLVEKAQRKWGITKIINVDTNDDLEMLSSQIEIT